MIIRKIKCMKRSFYFFIAIIVFMYWNFVRMQSKHGNFLRIKSLRFWITKNGGEELCLTGGIRL